MATATPVKTPMTKKELAKQEAEFNKRIAANPLQSEYVHSLQVINTMLMSDPDEILLMAAALRAKRQKKDSPAQEVQASSSQDMNWAEVEKGSDIPKWFIWEWLKQKETGNVLTPTLIDKMDRKDRVAVRKICCRHTGIDHSTRIPEAMRSNQVFFKVMDERYGAIGRDVDAFLAQAVNRDTGVIDWNRAQAYEMGDEDEATHKILQFRHVKSGVLGVFPTTVSVNDDWRPYNQHSDVAMRWEKDKIPVSCSEYIRFDVASIWQAMRENNVGDLKVRAERLTGEIEAAMIVASAGAVVLGTEVLEAKVERRRKRAAPKGAPAPAVAPAPAAVGAAGP